MKDIKRYPLGRNESPPDPRDWDLQNFAEVGITEPEVPITSRHHLFLSKSLDQGQTGHCVGFDAASFRINEPTYTPCTNEDGHDYYYMCKEFDGEPGDEGGSNLRSAAKTLQKIGAINNYAFARDFETIKWWLLNKGPLMFGTVWFTGMYKLNEMNTAYPTGIVDGGHAWLGNGIDEEYVYGQNSWGENWGDNGAFRILIADFINIMSMGGEALAAVEVVNVSTKKLSLLEIIINFIISLFKKGV